jgi:hypothetical protein
MALIYVVPPLAVLSGSRWAACLGAAAWLLMAAVYAPVLRFYRLRLAWAPFLPLVAIFYTGATVLSAIRYWQGRGAWKGRVLDSRSG